MLVVSRWLVFGGLTGAEEYCQFDTFNATCRRGQVIVIDDAQYGRLRIGRCVSRDYGFLGCTADVVDMLDRTCSGRRRCELPVPRIRQLVQPCPKDLTSYLDASYHCERGHMLHHFRDRPAITFTALKPNSITLAGSEPVRS